MYQSRKKPFCIFRANRWLLALTGRALDWTIEGLLVQTSPPTESLYYVLEQDTLSAA